jgi:hypothetical protein
MQVNFVPIFPQEDFLLNLLRDFLAQCNDVNFSYNLKVSFL